MTRLQAGRLRLILALITGVLAICAIVASILTVRYQDEIANVSRYNKTFDIGQAANELLRLEAAIAAGLVPGSEAIAGETSLRYQIVVGRLHSTLAGEASAYRSGEVNSQDLFQDLGIVLAEVGTLMERVREPAVAARAIRLIHPLHSRLTRLSSLSHSQSGDAVAAMQNKLLRVFNYVSAVIVALVGFGVALIFVVSRQNAKADYMAHHDALTGISNRVSLNNMLQQMRPGTSHAIILLDVDHFKDINDTLGHIEGDQFLIALAERLSGALGDADLFARLGGDEFAILFKGVFTGERASDCAARIIAALREPLRMGTHPVRASVSMGIAKLRRDEPLDPVALLKNADLALYAAKAAGRGRACVYQDEMNRNAQRRQQLVQGLSGAMAGGELFLAFQPIVDFADHRISGFEALLRWRHPELGLVSPAEFIPVAENSGLIVEIGRWVVAEACRAAAQWPDRIGVAINVSSRQFADPRLVGCIEGALAEHGIDPSRLTVEITESVLIENDEAVLEVLQHLRRRGVRVALDDFGTGYASLGYLRRFAFDKVKIDQSFVRTSESDASSLAIVSAICGLARSLKLQIVAEGIETEEHRALVSAAGCHFGQGYLFDRPLSLDVATSRVRLAASTSSYGAADPAPPREPVRRIA